MCGIFGIANHSEASNLTYLGLYALQHRGQEGAGIVSTDGKKMYKIRRRELVSDTFENRSFDYLKGNMAIGHVRYSTSGDNDPKNVQPFTASGTFGTLSVAHNGNLTNFVKLKRELENQGAIFQSTMDTEVILHLAARSEGETLSQKISEGLKKLEGAYSLIFISEEELIVVRDAMGFRPLCVGKLGKSPVFASETCAFDLIGAKYEREVEPGEMIVVKRDGTMKSSKFTEPKPPKSCVFEHIYFARPDSLVYSQSVYEIRKNLGRELAKEYTVKLDVVVPVPDSGVITAMGYADESKTPLEMGFIRNHYVGRTFIEPKQAIRGFGVRVKLNPVPQILKGKRVALIDDSIVRGTTSKKIIKMIREAGAKEVHMLISSPPVTHSCYYGIDTPTRKELIAANQSIEETQTFIGADQLYHLSMDGVYRAVGRSQGYCDACFTGKYPTPIYENKGTHN